MTVIGLPRCTSGAATLEGGRIAVGGAGGGVCSIDLRSGQTLASWRGDDDRQKTVVCAHDGRLTVARADGLLADLEVDGTTGTMKERRIDEEKFATCYCMSQAPGGDGILLVARRSKGPVEILWRNKQNKWSHVDASAPKGSEDAAGLAVLGNVVIFGGKHMLRAYAVGHAKKSGLACSQSDQGRNPLCALACHGRLCATAHRDGLIKVWRGLDDVERVAQGHGFAQYAQHHWHASACQAVALLPGTMVSGGPEATLVVWRLGREDGERRRDFLPRLGGPVAAVTIASTPEEDRCLVSCVDGALHLCRIGEGRLAVLWTSSSLHCPHDVNFFPLARGIASNGLPGALQLYDGAVSTISVVPHNRTNVKERVGDDPILAPTVTLAAFSKDEGNLVTCDDWRPSSKPAPELKFWALKAKQWTCAAVVRHPHGRGVAVDALAFHPLLVVAASTGPDGIRTWGCAGKQGWVCLGRAAHDLAPPRQLAFSDDCTTLAAHHAGTVSLWAASSLSLVTTHGAPDAKRTPLAVGFVNDADGRPMLAAVDAKGLSCASLFDEGAWTHEARYSAGAVVPASVNDAGALVAATRGRVQVFRADSDACVFEWAVDDVVLLAAPSFGNVFVGAAGRYLHLRKTAPSAPLLADAPTPHAPLVVVRAPATKRKRRAPCDFGDLLEASPRVDLGEDLETAAAVCDAVLDAGLKV